MKETKCTMYPRLKGYKTYEEALKWRKRKYGVSGSGAEPTFKCSCGMWHVDINIANALNNLARTIWHAASLAHWAEGKHLLPKPRKARLS